MNNRNWCLVAAAAAMVAAPSVARADDMTNSATSTTTTSTTTTTWTPLNIPVIEPAPLGPNGQPIDYSILTNRGFDAVDLAQAHAEGFSDSEIAVIAKMADKSGWQFNDIAQMALNGQAFPTIANRLNIRLSDVLNAKDYEDKISAYKVAYQNTGTTGFRNLVAGSRQEYAPYSTTNNNMSYNTQDIASVINNSSDLTMFARALRTANLTSVLRGPGPVTVFAPTDAAFAKLSNDQINSLMSDPSALLRVLNYHIIPQRITAAAAMAMTSPTSPATLEGDPLNVTTGSGSVMINGANVVQSDIFTNNGVIHKIDTVLMPPTTTTTTTTTTVTTPTTATP